MRKRVKKLRGLKKPGNEVLKMMRNEDRFLSRMKLRCEDEIVIIAFYPKLNVKISYES